MDIDLLDKYLISIVQEREGGRIEKDPEIRVYERLEHTQRGWHANRTLEHVRYVDSFPLVEDKKHLSLEQIYEKVLEIHEKRVGK